MKEKKQTKSPKTPSAKRVAKSAKEFLEARAKRVYVPEAQAAHRRKLTDATPASIAPSAELLEAISDHDATESVARANAEAARQIGEVNSRPQPNARNRPELGTPIDAPTRVADPRGDRLVGLAAGMAARAEVPSAFRADPSLQAGAVDAVAQSLIPRRR